MTDTVDTTAKPVDPLADKIMILKFSVQDINGVINMMNTPNQTPVIAWANLIANIQAQCNPQIEAINANMTAETQNGSETTA